MNSRQLVVVCFATGLLVAAAACSGGAPAPAATQAQAPSASQAATPAADPEAVLREFIAAVNAGDDARAAALLADNAQIFDEPTSRASIDKVRSLNCKAEIVATESSGDTVNVRLRFTGTPPWWSGESCQVTPQGQSGSFVVTVRGGRIVALRGG